MSRRSQFGLDVDEEMFKKWKEEEARERHEQDVINWCANIISQQIVIDDDERDPSNYFHQLGQPLWPHQLEAMLKKVRLKSGGSLHFEYDFWKPHKKQLYHLTNQGRKHICAYDNLLMPERSVIRARFERVRDMDIRKYSGRDIPKGTYVPGVGTVWDDEAALPGWKKVLVNFGEDPMRGRGWRTVLLKLVESGVATPAELERVFTPDNTRNWAAKTGNRSDIVSRY